MVTASRSWRDGEPQDPDAEVDHRALARSKTQRGKCFLADSAPNLRCALTTWLSELVDFLRKRAHHLDELGKPLLDAHHAQPSLFWQCWRQLTQLVAAPLDQGRVGGGWCARIAARPWLRAGPLPGWCVTW